VESDGLDALTTRGSRMPRTLDRLQGRPIAAYNLGYQEGRDQMYVNPAYLITPHGEKVPIPRHVAEQIRSIEFMNAQPVRIETGDVGPYFGGADYTDGEREKMAEMPSEGETAQAELPVEHRITDAFLDGYAQGFREGRHGRHR
jgi:hypothetical protein